MSASCVIFRSFHFSVQWLCNVFQLLLLFLEIEFLDFFWIVLFDKFFGLLLFNFLFLWKLFYITMRHFFIFTQPIPLYHNNHPIRHLNNNNRLFIDRFSRTVNGSGSSKVVFIFIVFRINPNIERELAPTHLVRFPN